MKRKKIRWKKKKRWKKTQMNKNQNPSLAKGDEKMMILKDRNLMSLLKKELGLKKRGVLRLELWLWDL